MKGKLAFNPGDYDYGPATSRIRALITLFADIDWFAPPTVTQDHAEALLREHRALCTLHRGDLFPAIYAIEQLLGDWADFVAQCVRVRHPHTAYDWKFGPLKDLSHRHARERGWSNSALAVDPRMHRPGDLFIRINNEIKDNVLVNPLVVRPDLRAYVPTPCQEAAGFYWGFATNDLHDAIQWELAEPGAPAGRNPFEPLLRCYAAGYYPFAVSPTLVRLFGFTRGELPVARVVS